MSVAIYKTGPEEMEVEDLREHMMSFFDKRITELAKRSSDLKAEYATLAKQKFSGVMNEDKEQVTRMTEISEQI